MRNLFCDHNDLRNEADVEQNFARRLIEALGYSDKAIRPKAALEELSIGSVGVAESHRPDFAMKAAGHIRWVLEAKAPTERLGKHFRQANGYCEAINDSYAGRGPVRFFVLTNGLETRVYEPGDDKPIISLPFNQVVKGNVEYRRLTNTLRPAAFVSTRGRPANQHTIRLSKPSIPEVNHVFAKCHQHIHQSDKISQAKGFEEFVKLITLKLLSDKAIRDSYPGLLVERRFDHPADDVQFSLRWIERHEQATPKSGCFHPFQAFYGRCGDADCYTCKKAFLRQGR